jgi:hypothetical protein
VVRRKPASVSTASWTLPLLGIALDRLDMPDISARELRAYVVHQVVDEIAVAHIHYLMLLAFQL